MEEIVLKLKEAIEIRSTIAKNENALWQKISEALQLYLIHQGKIKEGTSDNSKGYLNTKQAAEYLGLKYGTLHGWRFNGTGPKYIKMGGAVRYRIDDLEDFANRNRPTLSPPYPRKQGS